MNFEKLLAILIDRALFFASGSTLARDDKFEGQPTPAEIAALGIEPAAAKEIEDKYHKPVRAQFFLTAGI
jgi:hypothetical protein